MRSLLLPKALAALISVQLAAAGKQWDVNVGKGGLVFDPPNLDGVGVGDTVTYHFFAKNHSVVQAAFAKPCAPLDGGFYSGFVPSASPDTPSATDFTITVNDISKPIWVYCAQTTGNHCQTGMVGSINAPATGNTLEAFKDAAAKTNVSTTPNFDSTPIAGLSNGRRTARVQVGQATAPNLVFNPANLVEPVGTFVEFAFNPKNHSVVQSSFKEPCVPLAGGSPFFSGFIPTAVSPSGAFFNIAIQNLDPIWFYCAQTNGDHCQSGMVGSINAPAEGNTFDAFVALAKQASKPSQAPPNGPLTGSNAGSLSINGTVLENLGGAAFDPSMGMGGGDNNNNNDNGGDNNTGSQGDNGTSSTGDSFIPPPGMNMSSYLTGMAGGGPPKQYSWGDSIQDETYELLQLLQFLDNALISVLWNGHRNLTTGSWAGAYPPVITRTLGSMGAQALVHRHTSTDCMKHFKKPYVKTCQYRWPIQNVEDFIQTSLILLLLQVGVLLDIQTAVVEHDPWMIPALGSNLGSKSRMTGVINMMQDHIAAAAPREVMLPPELVHSYVQDKFVVSGSCPTKTKWDDDSWPALEITEQKVDYNGRTTSIKVGNDVDDDSWMTWIGPWGHMEYTKLDKDGNADVPQDMWGHVWAVMTKGQGANLDDLVKSTKTGPEMVWVTQPFNNS